METRPPTKSWTDVLPINKRGAEINRNSPGRKNEIKINVLEFLIGRHSECSFRTGDFKDTQFEEKVLCIFTRIKEVCKRGHIVIANGHASKNELVLNGKRRGFCVGLIIK